MALIEIDFAAGTKARVRRPQLASALRQTLRAGYGRNELRSDVLAGIVVGIVALPLAMALAIASGVPPQHGLYTAIIAGSLIALLGGSNVQVSGPTAAFVVILAPISAKFGVGGLLIATCLAGMMLVFMGLAGMGRLIEFIPYPVVTGFTSGIAVVIATLQVKDLLGLSVAQLPDRYLDRVAALWDAAPTAHAADFVVGAATFLVLWLLPKWTKRVPAPLAGLAFGGLMAFLLSQAVPGFDPATINSRFQFQRDGQSVAGIPQLPPMLVLPWTQAGPDGDPVGLSWNLIWLLSSSAFAIAMLGAIESLLSAVVADGMTGNKHDPNAELIAQGIGNMVAPFFGGIAATGAIARTATNVRCGARSPIASLVHAGFVLLAVVLLAPLLGFLPMASLAALLLVVAWNMSEAKHFFVILRTAPKSDIAVLVGCFTLTVVFDMVVSVTVGVVAAAMLFMRRMADVTEVSLVGPQHARGNALPAGVLVYEIAGPLFFGAAHKAMSALRTIDQDARVVVFDVRSVPFLDATGLVSIASAIDRLHRMKVYSVLAGIHSQPLRAVTKAGWSQRDARLSIHRSFQDGLQFAIRMVLSDPTQPPVLSDSIDADRKVA